MSHSRQLLQGHLQSDPLHRRKVLAVHETRSHPLTGTGRGFLQIFEVGHGGYVLSAKGTDGLPQPFGFKESHEFWVVSGIVGEGRGRGRLGPGFVGGRSGGLGLRLGAGRGFGVVIGGGRSTSWGLKVARGCRRARKGRIRYLVRQRAKTCSLVVIRDREPLDCSVPSFLFLVVQARLGLEL